MTRTSLLFGLAILAEAGIAWLVPAEARWPAQGLGYALLGGAATLGRSRWPAMQTILALGAFGCVGAVARGAFAGSELAIVALLAPCAGAAVGASLGHFMPRLGARYRLGSRGQRASERRPGLGLTVRIGGQAFSVRDWSVFGLFIDAPSGRFRAKQEVAVELEAGATFAAEVVRVAGAGVGLRFTRLADAERAALRRRFLETSLAA